MAEGVAALVTCARAVLAERSPAPPEHGARAATATCFADIGPLLDLATSHGMVRLLLARIDLDAAPAGVAARIVAERRASTAAALAAAQQMAAVWRSLDGSGIRTLPYKGPSLALDAYGDATLRTCDDLDFVVPERDAAHAYRVLHDAGYAPADGSGWLAARMANDWQGQVRMVGEPGRLPVELHWRFCDRKLPWNPDVEVVLGRARTESVAGTAVPIPSTADQIVLVGLHAARHGWDRLEPLVCMAALVARGVDGEELLARAREARGLRATLAGLEAARLLCDAPLPAAVVAAIDRNPVVVALAAESIRRVETGDAGSRRDLRLHAAMLDSAADRARYYALALLLPTPLDLDVLRLPSALRLLYVPVRIARLLWRAVSR